MSSSTNLDERRKSWRKWYILHKDRILESHRQWREKNPSYHRMKRLEREQAWHSGISQDIDYHEVAERAEDRAHEILRELGFENIMHVSELHHFFPCDFIASREGRDYLVNVTTYWYEKIKKVLPLARRLRLGLAVLFIKPDLSRYWLKEVDTTKEPKAICLPISAVRGGR